MFLLGAAIDLIQINHLIDSNLIRPAEVDTLLADYSKAKKILNWKPKMSFDDLVVSMVEHDLKNVSKSGL